MRLIMLETSKLRVSSSLFLFVYLFLPLFVLLSCIFFSLIAKDMDTCDKFYTNYYKSYMNTMSKYQV